MQPFVFAHSRVGKAWLRIPAGLRDVLARTFHSAWQAALVIVGPVVATGLSVQAVRGLPWAALGITAGVAAAVSLLTSLLSWRVRPQYFWQDALIRAAKTTAAIYLGALTATGFDALHFDWVTMLAAGLVAGVTALGRAIVSASLNGGIASYNSVVYAKRQLTAADAAVVGDGTTVTPASWHGAGAADVEPDAAAAVFTPFSEVDGFDDDGNPVEYDPRHDVEG